MLARFLFPVDPLDLVRDEARGLRERFADALDEVGVALAARDRERAAHAQELIDGIDDRRLEDALALARDVARKAPRRRPLRRRLDALGTAWHELGLAASDARAIAAGALRVLGEESGDAERLAAAVHSSAAAVRSVDPARSREAAEQARADARRLLELDGSFGTAVLAHGVIEVAEHALRAAAAREADRRAAAELDRRRLRARLPTR